MAWPIRRVFRLVRVLFCATLFCSRSRALDPFHCSAAPSSGGCYVRLHCWPCLW